MPHELMRRMEDINLLKNPLRPSSQPTNEPTNKPLQTLLRPFYHFHAEHDEKSSNGEIPAYYEL